MTNERMALLDLVEKDADSDLVRDMLAFAAERMMEAEAEVAAGAAKEVSLISLERQALHPVGAAPGRQCGNGSSPRRLRQRL